MSANRLDNLAQHLRGIKHDSALRARIKTLLGAVAALYFSEHAPLPSQAVQRSLLRAPQGAHGDRRTPPAGCCSIVRK
jgi:hypothetical protein